MQGATLIDPVWDTVCTFGTYQHETINGEPCITVHDASTCKQMLDDFAAHPLNDIFYDKQHEVVDELGPKAVDDEALRAWAGDGHAMAWANALVMILGGQIARYEAHPGAPEQPPSPEEVLRQSDGAMRPDGVYCRRYMVTPRGADPISGIAAFRYTSPFFVPEKDGHRILNLTVTNDPRMRDCALAFQRSSGRAVAMSRIKGVAMTSSAERAYRIAEDHAGDLRIDLKDARAELDAAQKRFHQHGETPGDAQTVQAKAAVVDRLQRQFEQAESDSRRKFDEWKREEAKAVRSESARENKHMDPKDAAVMTAAGIGPDDSPEDKMSKMTAYARKMEECAQASKMDVDPSNLAQNAAIHLKTGNVHDEGGRKSSRMESGASKMDAPFAGKETPGEEAAEHAEMLKDVLAQLAAQKEKTAMLEEALRSRSQEDDHMRQQMKRMEEERKMEEARKFARSALAMGRFPSRHKGAVDETREFLAKRHMENAKAAQELLATDGTFECVADEAQVMQRLTANGAGIGQPNPREGMSDDDVMDSKIRAEIAALTKEGVDPKKVDITAMAMKRVAANSNTGVRRVAAVRY